MPDTTLYGNSIAGISIVSHILDLGGNIWIVASDNDNLNLKMVKVNITGPDSSDCIEARYTTISSCKKWKNTPMDENCFNDATKYSCEEYKVNMTARACSVEGCDNCTNSMGARVCFKCGSGKKLVADKDECVDDCAERGQLALPGGAACIYYASAGGGGASSNNTAVLALLQQLTAQNMKLEAQNMKLEAKMADLQADMQANMTSLRESMTSCVCENSLEIQRTINEQIRPQCNLNNE